MKRRLLIIVVFLLLGAATTVAVCWASACRPLSRHWSSFAQEGYSNIGGGIWEVHRSDRFARVRVRSIWIFEWAGSHFVAGNLPPARDLLPRWSRTVDRLEPGVVNSADVIVEGTGWPLVAMLAHYQLDPGVRDTSGSYYFPIRSAAGILIGDKGDVGRRILPTRIVWFGFVIDTTALGALWWFVLCGPFALRRFWRFFWRGSRARRGLCPRCAYPMGESPVCTECGEIKASAGGSEAEGRRDSSKCRLDGDGQQSSGHDPT